MPRLVKRGDVYYAEYYDSERGFTTRRTTGTDDRREARKILGELIAKGSDPVNITSLKRAAVSDLLATYYAENKSMPSKYAIKATLSYLIDEIPVKSVEWFGYEGNQKSFIKMLRDRGLSDGTVQRTMGIIGAALRQAYRKAGAPERPYIITVQSHARRDRILTDDEASALVRACETENEKRLVLLLLTTGSRPQAVMDLMGSQLDRENRLINLNPVGRAQNSKKHRPIIPMTEAVYEASENWGDGPVFVVQSDHDIKHRPPKRLKHVRYVWGRLRKRAGLPEDVTPYVCRHTVATELRKQGVAEWDVSGYLGHKAPGSSTTAIYAHWRPDFMAGPAKAMDAYWRRINERGAGSLDAGGDKRSDHAHGACEGVLAAGE